MPDVFSRAVRSRIMRAIRSRDTKPELALAAALRRAGLRLSRRTGHLPGRPDFTVASALAVQLLGPWRAHQRTGLAVFVHGCFWHCCPRHFRPPKSGEHGRAAWARKFEGNRRRDRRVRRRLRRMGWRTTVVWEHEDMASAALRVLVRVQRRR